MNNPLTRAEHNEFAKRMEDEHNRQNKRIAELETRQKKTTNFLRLLKNLLQTSKTYKNNYPFKEEKLKN